MHSTNDKTRIHVLAVDGEGVRRLTGGNDFSPRWSPDGSTIAFTRHGRGLYTVTANATRLRRLQARASGPAWSPDGSLIAYFSGIRPSTIYLIRPDGSGRTRLAEQQGDGVGALAWSPHSRRIAYAAHRPHRGWDIYVVATDGSGRQRLTENRGDEVFPVWSPDGAAIAFERSDVSSPTDNTGTYDIYLVNADGTGTRRLTDCRCVSGGGLSWQPPPPNP
jgi:Tol biopolymer transport system component